MTASTRIYAGCGGGSMEQSATTALAYRQAIANGLS